MSQLNEDFKPAPEKMHKLSDTLDSLISKGLVEMLYDEDQEDWVYRLTEVGRLVAEQVHKQGGPYLNP